MEITPTAVSVWWAFILSFTICELGQRVTSKFKTFGENLSASNWYSLPLEFQRIYLIFLLESQQPIRIESYCEIICSRETFKRVILKPKVQMCFTNFFNDHFQIINKGFSYFMGLREMR